MKKLLIFIPLLSPLQACNSANAESPELAMEYEILHEDAYNEYANVTSKSTIILHKQSDYEQELIKRTSEAVKAIDFTTESVVLIDMGPQSTGGYSISFSFTEYGEYIKADVVFNFPGEACILTQAITNPFTLIKLATTKYILVSEEITFSDC